MDNIRIILLYIQKIYYWIYRPMVDTIDKHLNIISYHILDILFHLFLWGRGLIEDYIIYKGYSSMSQFERALTPQSEVYLTMQIDYRMTWVEIHDKIWEISKINLSKRQCYKLKNLAKEGKKSR